MNMQKRKKTQTFNIIDVALIIIALTAISALIFFLSGKGIKTNSSGEMVQLEYTVEFSGIREEFRNLIEIGDSLTDNKTSADMGEVVNILYSDYIYTGTNADGQKIETVYPGKITITVTVRTEAVKTKDCYVINGQKLILGETLDLHVPDFTGIGKCISVVQNEG